MRGTVVKLLGKVCTVRSDGDRYVCHLRGRLFEKPGAQIAAGDLVEFDPVEKPAGRAAQPEQEKPQGVGVIHEILPRRSALSRPPTRRGGDPQIIAANVDQLVVVSSVQQPALKTGLIDRYLIIADRAGVAPVVCVNKVDLANPAELEALRAELRAYQKLGLPLVLTSAVTSQGIAELRELLKEKRSVLAGHSGVGKSRLAGAIQPGLSLATSLVSRSGKGRHTTAAASLIALDFGGELVDTPGVRELGISDVPREELAQHFAEFVPYLGFCRFKSCSHIPEPGCAVKEALAKGKVHRSRYDSYAHLYHELAAGAQ